MRITENRLRRIIRSLLKESQFIFESENRFAGWFSDAKEKKINKFFGAEEDDDDFYPSFEDYEAMSNDDYEATQNDDEYENFIKNLNNGGHEPIEWSKENKMPIGSHGFREGGFMRFGHIDLRKSATLDGVKHKVDIDFVRNPIASVLDKFLGEHYLDYHLYGLKFYAELIRIIEHRYESYYSSVFDKTKIKEQVDIIIEALQERGFRLIATSKEEKDGTPKYIELMKINPEEVEKEVKSYAEMWEKIKSNKEELYNLVWKILDALNTNIDK